MQKAVFTQDPLMKKRILCSLLFSTNLYAGTLACDGTVETVAYHSNDKLMVKLSSMNTPVFFCNPSAQWTAPGAAGRVMSAETCKTVFSMFLTAKASNQHITKVHFDGDNVPSSCSMFVSYSEVFVRYVNY